MARTGGKRRAAPPPRRSARSARAAEGPAPGAAPPAATTATTSVAVPAPPLPPPPRPRPQRPPVDTTRWTRRGWTAGALLTVVAVAVLLAVQVGALDDPVAPYASVAITTAFGTALAARTGGRPGVTGGLCLVLASVAVAVGPPLLVAGVAAITGVVTAVLAVMLTVPAAGFRGVVREVVVAVLVAATGALGVAGYAADVSRERLSYTVLALALALALALVFRLGAGLHGLGRRGFVILAGGLVAVTITLAYAEALRNYASPGLLEAFETFVARVEARLGGVPQPIEIGLGFPALAWGVAMRARRRQGWWVCAFGVAATSTVATSLATSELTHATLSLLYSLPAGLLVGYAVIRLDLFITGPRGRRARQLEEASAHRPEPQRTEALL